MALDTLDTWAAPFDNAECSLVTPVPYGDLHSVSPYVATPQVRLCSIYLLYHCYHVSQAAVDLILTELQLTDEDYLVDLGCGTARWAQIIVQY